MSRCVDANAARAWWGTPFLAPRDAGDARYVLQQQGGTFAAEAGPGSSLVVVLTYGGPTADDGDGSAVLDGGGILVMGVRSTQPGEEVTHSYPIRIRGHAGRVYDAASATDSDTKRRVISWDVRDGDEWLRWRVIEDGEHHTFKEVVTIVESLVET